MSILQTPGSDGRFGEFGGRYVPETLVPACQELEAAFEDAWNDPLFRADLDQLLREYAGRPSMITECHNLSEQLGIRLFLKREDLQHHADQLQSRRRLRHCLGLSARCTWVKSTLLAKS